MQEELREEREHCGSERIAKLEEIIFTLQTRLGCHQQKIDELKSCVVLTFFYLQKNILYPKQNTVENRKLTENSPINEMETIEFLSRSLHQKDEHLHVL